MSNPATTPSVSVRSVRFAHGEAYRLKIANFRAEAGESVAVIGASGSGKSTLLNLIGGLLRPDVGEIVVAGRSTARMSDRQRRRFRGRSIGWLSQELELIGHLDAWDNITLPFRLNADLKLDEQARERIGKLAERLGVATLLKRLPRRLSQGERQRIALCRALAVEPAVILADEPTASLDPESAQRVFVLLREEAARIGAVLIVATHDHGALGEFPQVVALEQHASGEFHLKAGGRRPASVEEAP